MRKIILILLLGLLTSNSISQITYADNIAPNDIKEFSSDNIDKTRWFKQFVIPIEADGVSVNNGITLTILGLTNSNNYHIKLAVYNTNPVVYFIDDPLIVNAGSATYDLIFNGASASTVYRIIIWNVTADKEFTFLVNLGGGIIKPYEFYIATERSKTGVFPNSSTNFRYKINWVDYWLNNHNAPLFTTTPTQFIADAEQSLKFSWQKQIFEWDLCNGVLNNQLLDDNNEFDLNVDGYKITGFPFRGGTGSNLMVPDVDRNISFDYLTQKIDATLIYNDEIAQLHSTIGHEFFHNVQYSHHQFQFDNSKNMRWLFEGQATFIKTMIMQEYSAPNEEYLVNRYYIKRTKDALELLLNAKPISNGLPSSTNGTGLYFKDLTDDIYPYAWGVFWRYLFDTYSQNSGALPNSKSGLKVILETVKHVTNSTTIQADMDNVLRTGGGTYPTLLDLLKNYMEDLYFCSNPISNFIDVNHNNFYSNARNDVSVELYRVKNNLVNNLPVSITDYYEEYVFDGANLNTNVYSIAGSPPLYYSTSRQQKIDITLDNPFQMQSREIFLTNGASGVRITVNNDVNGDGNSTHIRAYITDNAGTIYSSQNISINGQNSGIISFPVVGNDRKLVLLFLRTDQPNAGQARTGDLEIRFTTACPGTDAVFRTNAAIIDAGSTVSFTKESCSNVNSWHWIFDGGIPHESNEESPVVEYPNAGTFTASLTVSDGVTNNTTTKQITVKPTMASGAEIDFIYKKETNELIGQSSAHNIYSWQWEFGDGSSSGSMPGPVFMHKFSMAEIIHLVTLKISFTDGSTKSKTQRIFDCGYPYHD